MIDINPEIKLNIINDFYTDNLNSIFTLHSSHFHYVADAIDTMRSKISLLETCVRENIPVISSMGAGNRIDPTKLYISDISEIENKNAPFVSNIIYQLKKRGIEKGITVVASREKPFSREKISEPKKSLPETGKILNLPKSLLPRLRLWQAAREFLWRHILRNLS